jgi:myo-inositol-1(or 4)-monophosphatase
MSRPTEAQQKTNLASTETLREIERLAVELATMAGAEIASALGSMLSVRYKTAATAGRFWQDPVSEADSKVERLIRAGVAARFPGHGIIGEEFDDAPGSGDGYVWCVDPIDGTVNFVNGFPLFACSIGVLQHGRPVAAALWCATGHALRSGIYHASLGNPLRFDGAEVVPRQNPAVRRRLASVPRIADAGVWDTRKTGSAAIECAFVAAGLLEAARFELPNLWDIAGGVMLAQASGAAVLARAGDDWVPFKAFDAPPADSRRRGLSGWRQSLIVGRLEPDALVAALSPVER